MTSTVEPTHRSASPALPTTAVWFTATFAICFTWSFFYSTWVSRGAEIQELLHLSTVQFGLFTMLYPLGGLVGVSFASAIVHRLGSRRVAATCFGVAALSLGLVGPTISGGHLWLAVLPLVLLGPPLATADFIANFEGSRVDKAAQRSLLPAIHGAFGLGMLSAAALAGLLSHAGVSIGAHFVAVAVVGVVVGGGASFTLPRSAADPAAPEPSGLGAAETDVVPHGSVWREKRTLLIAFIGFAFVMSETAVGSWVPIALTDTGFSSARAAFALSVFWVVVTAVRLCGGLVVDRLGRVGTARVAALLTASGIAVFMLTHVVALPYVGLVLWAAGMAIGFTMAVSAMGDDSARAAARINMLITIVYVASISVGPVLGAVGQLVGVYTSFAIPLVLLLAAAWLAPVVERRD